MTTGCPTTEDLSTFHDGELAGAEAERVASHVATCDACAAALGRLRRASDLLGSLPRESASDELVGRTARLASASTAARRGPAVPRWLWTTATAAGLVLGVLLLGRLVRVQQMADLEPRARVVAAMRVPARPSLHQDAKPVAGAGPLEQQEASGYVSPAKDEAASSAALPAGAPRPSPIQSTPMPAVLDERRAAAGSERPAEPTSSPARQDTGQAQSSAPPAEAVATSDLSRRKSNAGAPGAPAPPERPSAPAEAKEEDSRDSAGIEAGGAGAGDGGPAGQRDADDRREQSAGFIGGRATSSPPSQAKLQASAQPSAVPKADAAPARSAERSSPAARNAAATDPMSRPPALLRGGPATCAAAAPGGAPTAPVMLRCRIDDRGHVRVLRVVGPPSRCDAAAKAAVAGWLYSPALVAGVPHAATMDVEVALVR